MYESATIKKCHQETPIGIPARHGAQRRCVPTEANCVLAVGQFGNAPWDSECLVEIRT